MKRMKYVIGLVMTMFFIAGCNTQFSMDAATGNKNIVPKNGQVVVTSAPAITGADLNQASKAGSDATQVGYEAAQKAFKEQNEINDRANTRTVIVAVVLALVAIGAVVVVSRRQQPIVVQMPNIVPRENAAIGPDYQLTSAKESPKQLRGGTIVIQDGVEDLGFGGWIEAPKENPKISAANRNALNSGQPNGSQGSSGSSNQRRLTTNRVAKPTTPLLTAADFGDDVIDGEVGPSK